MTKQAKNSRFKKGSGAYTCASCKHKTRATGQSEDRVELCALCYEITGLENEIADCGSTPEREAKLAELQAALERRNSGKKEAANMANKKAKKKTTKVNAKDIAVGTTTEKYAAVKFDPAKIVAMHKEGKNVSQIAQAIGYPKGHGNNRTRRVLEQAGLLK